MGTPLTHLLLLSLCFFLTLATEVEIEEVTRTTLSTKQAHSICQHRSSPSSKHPFSVTHPSYCSRYITCAISTTPDEDGNRITATEHICPRCDHSTPKVHCPYGFKNWHEESQSCVIPFTQDKCRQMELSQNNKWGLASLTSVCNDSDAGEVILYPDPTSCSGYIKCYRDPVFKGDIWAVPDSCPPCDPTNALCGAEGYHHYAPPTENTEGVCHLPGSMTEHKCDSSMLESVSVKTAPTHHHMPLAVEDNFPSTAQTAYASQFCVGTEKLPQRHAIPGQCNKYFYCWANLFDSNGDERPLAQVKHYEFTCPTCFERESEGAKCPPPPPDGVNTSFSGYLHFDFTAQDCVIPTKGGCSEDGQAPGHAEVATEAPMPLEQEEEKPNSPAAFAEARAFCRQRDPVPGRVASPAKCHTYYACWATLFDKSGKQRELDKVLHFKFKCDKTPSGKGYEIFSNAENKCVRPGNGKVCMLDGNWGKKVKKLKKPKRPASKIRKGGKNKNKNKQPQSHLSQVFEGVEPEEEPESSDPITIFCKQKGVDGNYLHPSDPTPSPCSRYIQCWFGEHLFKEMQCPICSKSQSPHSCPYGRLFFNPVSGDCEAKPNSQVCIPPPNMPTTPQVTPDNPSGSSPPIVDPELLDSSEKQSGPSNDVALPQPDPAGHPAVEHPAEQNSESLVGPESQAQLPGPLQEQTTAKPNPLPPISEPDVSEPVDTSHLSLSKPKKCSPKRFVQHGYCKNFFSCNRKTRKEKKGICSGRLYWNPDAQTLHGGRCDFLKNLKNFTLHEYQKDPECPLHIVYFRSEEEKGPCSSTYYFHHPQRTEGKEIQLSCPDDLLWSKEKKTCVLCEEMFKVDGITPCCGNGKEQINTNDAEER